MTRKKRQGREWKQLKNVKRSKNQWAPGMPSVYQGVAALSAPPRGWGGGRAATEGGVARGARTFPGLHRPLDINKTINPRFSLNHLLFFPRAASFCPFPQGAAQPDGAGDAQGVFSCSRQGPALDTFIIYLFDFWRGKSQCKGNG